MAVCSKMLHVEIRCIICYAFYSRSLDIDNSEHYQVWKVWFSSRSCYSNDDNALKLSADDKNDWHSCITLWSTLWGLHDICHYSQVLMSPVFNSGVRLIVEQARRERRGGGKTYSNNFGCTENTTCGQKSHGPIWYCPCCVKRGQPTKYQLYRRSKKVAQVYIWQML